jgi:hypothetical protein
MLPLDCQLNSIDKVLGCFETLGIDHTLENTISLCITGSIDYDTWTIDAPNIPMLSSVLE